jgi:DNA polymerase-3 subunit alpha
MRDLLRKLKPTEFTDLVALLALHRPGPLNSGMVDEFILSKHNRRTIKYLHPQLRPILEETYGVIVYQEQVMRIASTLAGFTMGEADELRRAMSKKDATKMERMKRLFIEGTTNRGIPKKKAEAIYNLMEKFAEYGFNKSHSAAYALISYWTAYLKAHFPLEYMAALLTSELNNQDKIRFYIEECRRMGIRILPPHINHSDTLFRVEDGGVRFGLAAVKNVGLSASRSIVEARERVGGFKSFYDFCEEIDTRIVNKRVIESLIKCGAFDGFGANRAQLYHGLEDVLKMADRTHRQKLSGQASLFDMLDEGSRFKKERRDLPKVDEWPHNRLLAFEKELLGLYLTSHPLIQYEKEIEEFADFKIEETKTLKEGRSVRVAGVIQKLKKINTRDGHKMATAMVEDPTGTIEAVIFPDVYEREKGNIVEDTPVLIMGKLSLDEDRPKIRAAQVIPLEEAKKKLAKEIHIRLRTAGLEEETLLKLRQIFRDFDGKVPAYLHLETIHHGEVILASRYRVCLDNGLTRAIEELLGQDAVSFKG